MLSQKLLLKKLWKFFNLPKGHLACCICEYLISLAIWNVCLNERIALTCSNKNNVIGFAAWRFYLRINCNLRETISEMRNFVSINYRRSSGCVALVRYLRYSNASYDGKSKIRGHILIHHCVRFEEIESWFGQQFRFIVTASRSLFSG